MIIYWRTNIPCKILQVREDNCVIIQYGENSITSCYMEELMLLN
jgi:hypothetical protein